MVGWSPQSGQAGFCLTRSVSQDWRRESWTRMRPTSGSPCPTMSLIVSATCTEPMAAHSTPSTPPVAHDGTESGGGGSGKTQR